MDNEMKAKWELLYRVGRSLVGDKEGLSREMGIQLTSREENPERGTSHRKLKDKLKVKVGKFLNLSHYTSSCYFSQHIDYKHKHKFLIFFQTSDD